MRIAITSDCHGMLSENQLPPGDVLILAGDILPNNYRNGVLDAAWQEFHLRRLDNICERLKYKHIIFVAGNHDWIAQYNERAILECKNFTYLKDSGVAIEGYRFYGAPWQPAFWDWAFNLPRGGEGLQAAWSLIPEDLDVLITHCPPHGMLDETIRSEHVGCELLAERVNQIRPKIHCFGHIHNSYGKQQIGETLFVNASMCDERYDPTNPPHVIDI